MAFLGHLLRQVPAARRAYSVFSKPGGGRYFNSAKPPKVAPAPTKVDTASPPGDASAKDQSTQPSSAAVTPEGSSTAPTMPSLTPFMPVHPAINAHDLRLHQFFSLHRPLLHVSQPASTIFESAPDTFTWPPAPPAETANVNNLEDPPEASPEEDADAARQLARALVVNRLGASIAWEDTLQKLGLDVTESRAEEVRAAETEFEVYMDSVKRKRRKKMKKHKLKKRRKLQRALRIKIGR
ncbi:hypothetical protein WOLCODRAFT_161115 [Wolfiporia cocos MD-104 SS10]|uniref:Small ribosomal subunit protein mS38 n=1 Tax=Wolfiporia cocos (strain MD-104) TaxID=742152 RepID=A0A2H3J6I3_WOLCO|nr:hypothetical protein WOLCODRAFT_161115 [Wolfiporia cocos MD-104 SS10]